MFLTAALEPTESGYVPYAAQVYRMNKARRPVGTKRHRRMPLDSAVLLMRGGECWMSEVRNISATGVLIRRPEGWYGERGDRFILDMLIGDDFNLHLEAVVARVDGDDVGFAFARIPPEKEVPLWNLLGRYADSVEGSDAARSGG